jgi:hypothetical protein
MPEPPAPPTRPRFRWPMRVLLSVLVFDIVFRCLSVLIPWSDWMDQLDMTDEPEPLPTRAELADPAKAREIAMTAADSVWDWFKPWPEKKTRKHLHSWADSAKFTACWLNSRLEWTERLVGVNEEWPMFSPSLATECYMYRARLVYADGSELIARGQNDPHDLTRYVRLTGHKTVAYDRKWGKKPKDWRKQHGYCHRLAHLYPHNEDGAPLKKVLLFRVRYDFPPPGVDARAFLEAQNGPPDDQVGPVFYVYDATTGKGRHLEKPDRERP